MELFIDLGLKEICGIVGLLGRNTDVENIQDVIEVNGKKYLIEKNGNTATITGPDNHKCTISVNYTEQEQIDHYNRRVIYINHFIDTEFLSPEGNSIKLHNNISLDRGYESFENVQRHDLMDGLRLSYNDQTDFNLGLTRFHLRKNKKVYNFTDNGVSFGFKELVIDNGSIKATPELSIEELVSIKEALSYRKEIMDEVKENTITPEVLDETEKRFRRILRERKEQERENKHK